MTDYTARIRAKGLDSTGITEEIARKMHANRGGYYTAVVELYVEETHDKAEGQHRVDLILAQVEPALDDRLDSHLRDLARTLHTTGTAHLGDGITLTTRPGSRPT